MSEPIKKFQWGYTGMIPFSETAEKLGLHAYVRIENYQFMQKRTDNLETENARLKAEVEELTHDANEADQEYEHAISRVRRLEAEIERLHKAGNWMAGLLGHDYKGDPVPSVRAWNDAKNGKPSA